MFHFVNTVQQLPFLLKLIKRNRPFLEKRIAELRYVTDQEIDAAYLLALGERKTIARKRSEMIFDQELSKKISVFYCEPDTWCPDFTLNYLKKQVYCKKLKARHDFILRKSERDILTKELGLLTGQKRRTRT